MTKKPFLAFALVAAVFSAVFPLQSARADAETLDIEGITLLVDLFGAIMAKHSDYETVSARMRDMDPNERTAMLEEMRRANEDDKTINKKIDAVLNSDVYRFYYSKFRNVTPKIHREIFYSLPYQSIKSPAGIAQNYLELCVNHESFASWVKNAVSKIDLERCNAVAAEWLPPGKYDAPATYFIADGNGDAFARRGHVCFDLFSLVIAKQPRETRFDDLSAVSLDDIERVLGHEFQHVHAAPLMKNSGRAAVTWQEKWKYRIVRQIVSEGVAMQCDVRSGMRRDAMEDTVTVKYWIGQLNEKLAALDAGTTTESDMQAWWGASYHATARELLKDYLRRTHPGETTDELLRKHAAARPSFVYTMGWWMISRILESDAGKDGVLGLLSDPQQLYALYNASRSAGDDTLRVNIP